MRVSTLRFHPVFVLDDATGPTAVALPLDGTSELAVADEPLHDSAFARRIAEKLDAYLRATGAVPG